MEWGNVEAGFLFQRGGGDINWVLSFREAMKGGIMIVSNLRFSIFADLKTSLESRAESNCPGYYNICVGHFSLFLPHFIVFSFSVSYYLFLSWGCHQIER